MATSKTTTNNATPTGQALQPHITRHIMHLREQRVMLDSDLAALYGVETKVLIQAIKRNAQRFPADFMFQLSTDEFANLRSQFVTSSSGYGGRRYAPYAFTEHGVAMLSSVLNSPRAIAINIEIMRAFVQIRSLALSHQDLAKRLASMETKHDSFSRQTQRDLKEVFDTLRELMTPPIDPTPPKRQIGFVQFEGKPAIKTKLKAKTVKNKK